MKNQTKTTNTPEKNLKRSCKAEDRFVEPIWKTSANDLLFDIKFMLREFLTATFTENGEALGLRLNNGQSFVISVREGDLKS